MKEIIEDSPYTYIWERCGEWCGCENCIIKKLSNIECPEDCDPNSGSYRMMTFDEMNSKRRWERMKDKPIYKNVTSWRKMSE